MIGGLKQGLLDTLSAEEYATVDQLAVRLSTSQQVVRRTVMLLRRDGYGIEGRRDGGGYRRTPEKDTVGLPQFANQRLAPAVDVMVIQSDDWDAVYIDGVKAYSGHEHLIRVAMELLVGKTVRSFAYGYAETGNPIGRHLEDYGDYPDTLDEIADRGEEAA